MGTARSALAGAGTQTAALAFGGETPVTGTNATEEYNGSCLDSRWKFGYSKICFSRSRNYKLQL
jgi:hypothetical protein